MHGIAVGDINGDGLADIAATEYRADATQYVAVFLSTGRGTLALAGTYEVLYNPVTVAIGDVNGDGHADVAVGKDYGVAVLLNRGDGTFGAPVVIAVSDAGSGLFVAFADVDRDGANDIVTVPWAGPQMTVLFNNGRGAYDRRETVDVGLGFVMNMAVGDFDRDGAIDVALSGFGDYLHYVAVFHNDGTGIYGPPTMYDARVPWGDIVPSIDVGDVNGDGFLDIVVVNSSNAAVVLVNDGHGAFSHAASHKVGTALEDEPNDVAVHDLDGNGTLDVVTTSRTANVVSVLLHR
jgi:VCBS repeat protein/FG-GAP repeat protein